MDSRVEHGNDEEEALSLKPLCKRPALAALR